MSATQATQKDPVIVVLQLTGGNDYLNTVIPYNNGLYKDNRKAVGIADSDFYFSFKINRNNDRKECFWHFFPASYHLAEF
jgi:uncharacterized protein (DUF1501 family)